VSSCCQAEAEGSRPPRDYRWLRIGAGAVIAGNSMLLGLAVNSSKIDQVSLECANSKVPLELIGLLKDKDVLVGAIDVATNDVETPEQVAATLKAAMEFVDPERTYPCTNCGLAPLPRNVSVGKLRALGAGAELVRKELKK